jgi:hypothetical protein
MKSWDSAARVTLAVLILSTAACTMDTDRVKNSMETETRTVPLGAAKEASVRIEIGAGELRLGGGASDLLEADFRFEKTRHEPQVDYRVEDGRGELYVRLSEGGRADVRLKDDVPMELAINLGAGKSTLELGSLALRKLNVNVGVGECTVDLGGDWRENLNARIKGGIGKAVVRIPEDTGVRVRARGGIGEIRRGPLRQKGDAFVNDAYGQSPVTLDIDIEGGIGAISIEESEGPNTI